MGIIVFSTFVPPPACVHFHTFSHISCHLGVQGMGKLYYLALASWEGLVFLPCALSMWISSPSAVYYSLSVFTQVIFYLNVLPPHNNLLSFSSQPFLMTWLCNYFHAGQWPPTLPHTPWCSKLWGLQRPKLGWCLGEGSKLALVERTWEHLFKCHINFEGRKYTAAPLMTGIWLMNWCMT